MKKEALDGIEIEQKLMESLDIAERYGFAGENHEALPTYEKTEKSVADLYKKYRHIKVTMQDELFGANDGDYEYIKTAKGLYKDVLNAGKI